MDGINAETDGTVSDLNKQDANHNASSAGSYINDKNAAKSIDNIRPIDEKLIFNELSRSIYHIDRVKDKLFSPLYNNAPVDDSSDFSVIPRYHFHLTEHKIYWNMLAAERYLTKFEQEIESDTVLLSDRPIAARKRKKAEYLKHVRPPSMNPESGNRDFPLAYTSAAAIASQPTFASSELRNDIDSNDMSKRIHPIDISGTIGRTNQLFQSAYVRQSSVPYQRPSFEASKLPSQALISYNNLEIRPKSFENNHTNTAHRSTMYYYPAITPDGVDSSQSSSMPLQPQPKRSVPKHATFTSGKSSQSSDAGPFYIASQDRNQIPRFRQDDDQVKLLQSKVVNNVSAQQALAENLWREKLLLLKSEERSNLMNKKLEEDLERRKQETLARKLEFERKLAEEKRKHDDEQLVYDNQHKELTSKYNHIELKHPVSNWLSKIKSFWNDIRLKNHKELFENHLDHEDNADAISINGDSITYNDPLVNGNIGPQDDLKMEGFIAIANMLERTSQDVYISVSGCNHKDKASWLKSPYSPCFCYDDNPIQGWRKEIVVRLNGKTRGSTEVVYVAPSGKRIRSSTDLRSFFIATGLSLSLLPKFTFKNVFCVCQKIEDVNRSYLECSFGMAGCRQWLHSECVGLGYLSEEQLRQMETVVCPYCTTYLEGLNLQSKYSDKRRLLRQITIPSPPLVTTINGFTIEASTQPHTVWGLENSLSSSSSSTNHRYVSKECSRWIRTNTQSKSPLSKSHNSRFENGDHRALSEELTANPVAKTTPSSSKQSGSALLPGIFQHRLFDFLQPSDAFDTFEDPISNNLTKAPLSVPQLLQMELNEGEKYRSFKYRDEVLPFYRKRYGRLHSNGSIVTVRVEGPSTKMKRKYDMDDDTLENRIYTKYIDRITFEDENVTKCLSLGQKYKRALIQEAFIRSSQRYDQSGSGRFMLNVINAPLDDGGIRVTCVNPTNLEEPCTSKSIHNLCVSNTICGLCLESFDASHLTRKKERAMTRPSSESKGTSNVVSPHNDRKRRFSNVKKKKILLSEVIKEKIKNLQRSDAIDYDEIDLITQSEDYNDVNHDLIQAIDASIYEGATERSFGVVSYLMHNSCVLYGISSISDDIQPSAKNYIQSIVPYQYDQVDDATCDLCGKLGGVLMYFQLDSSRLKPPSPDGWLGHVPCIRALCTSNLLHPLSNSDLDAVNWASLYMKKVSDEDAVTASTSMDADRPTSSFDIYFDMYTCGVCGKCCGITYRCIAISCMIHAHASCMIMSQGMGWTEVSIESNQTRRVDEVVENSCSGYVCPVHSPYYQNASI